MGIFMSETIYDLAVIGGGVNGAGIARDAAGRGVKVILLERVIWRAVPHRHRPS
jgi:glycerol-3-phosphate dehydrogenase